MVAAANGRSPWGEERPYSFLWMGSPEVEGHGSRSSGRTRPSRKRVEDESSTLESEPRGTDAKQQVTTKGAHRRVGLVGNPTIEAP
ncbi:hypothetical protein CDL15_Pgr027326 [Punica granatum]|nr:hypothetical protein CDL15_Pgr027326 [Punica granatum]